MVHVLDVVQKMTRALATVTICIPFGLLSCERQEARWAPREGDRIGAVEIRYVGATSGHEARLTNFLHLTAGSAYTAEAVDRDIRALYESGHVEDVRVLAESIGGDVGLVFEVVSRPPSGPPVFVGNTAFSDVRLAREIDFGAGTRSEDMTLERLQAYAEAIKHFYRREGYPQVGVRLRAFGGGPATPADFQFLIEEGDQQSPK